MRDLFIAAAVVICVSAFASLAWVVLTRRVGHRRTQELRDALSTTHAVFTALDQIPNTIIPRDLRVALVLLVNYHLDKLTQLQPQHPHLAHLQSRLHRLNQMPNGLRQERIRSSTERKAATTAMDELSKILKKAALQNQIAAKQASLATAAANFSAQQIAVESARQSAKDAENVRAYGPALNFAYQAQALCKKLPPLMGKSLGDAIAQDIERLQDQASRPVRT